MANRIIVTHKSPKGTAAKNTIAVPDAAGATLVTLDATQTLSSKTLTAPVITGATVSSSINSDIKRCSTATTADQTTTLANITGLTGFALVASGVYEFDVNLHVTCSTNAGIGVAFKYTTATLTSIQCKPMAFAAASVLNVAQNTTATDANLKFNDKSAAWLNVILRGTLVVNAAGTLAVQMAQETSHTDVTTVLVGSTARFTRIS
jgi:hypothetical protein